MNHHGMPSDAQIAELLCTAKVIAVVGLSSKKWRASYGVSEFLQSSGYRIIPVNPREKEVLGEKGYARLEDVPEKVDIVDVFRRSEAVPGAKAVWMQESVAHEAAAARARAAGLLVVQDTCILKEHHRLLK
jgi:predicted CoA-binding protein